MNSNEEQTKVTTNLEANIIDIPVPDNIPEINQLNQTITPIPEVQVKEYQTEEKNNNPMVENNQEDEKVTGKSLAPLIIVFTIFIVSIIGLPYIDDLIALINPKPTEEEVLPSNPENTNAPTPIETPIVTPTPSATTVPSEIIDELTQ